MLNKHCFGVSVMVSSANSFFLQINFEKEIKIWVVVIVGPVLVSRVELDKIPESDYATLQYTLCECTRTFFFNKNFLPKNISFSEGVTIKTQPDFLALLNDVWHNMAEIETQYTWDEEITCSYSAASRAWVFMEVRFPGGGVFTSVTGGNIENIETITSFCNEYFITIS
jgi:hypothetical protein